MEDKKKNIITNDEAIELNSNDEAISDDIADATDKAVDDIIKHESDELIEKEDEKVRLMNMPPVRSLWQRCKVWVQDFWADKTKRNTFLISSAVFLAIFFILPVTRYGFFNMFGVRASVHVRVVDTETRLPLKNVKVTIDNKESSTDIDGIARLEKIKLGTRTISITKLAYADITKKVSIGFGGNELAEQTIEATGARYTFLVQDWLSGHAIEKAEAEFGENNALSDGNGMIILTIPPTEENAVTVTLKAEGYEDKAVDINTDTKDSTTVSLITAVKAYYISNRDGRFDVYESSANGEHEKVLIEGTGLERESSLRFSVDPTNMKAVLVATRDNVKNKDGYMLSGLYIIDLQSGTIEKKDESERIDIIGWADGTIVYVKIAAGASGTNPGRHRLTTLNIDTNEVVELAASNYFNDVLVAQNYIIYAPSSAFNENKQAYLYRVKADGSDKQTIFDREVWSIVQTEYDAIFFDSKQQWYKSGISVIYANSQSSAPGSRASRLYAPNPNGEQTAWIDQRDGKGVLLLQDIKTSEDTDLLRMTGLRHPLRWLSESHLMFRVITENETADYIINIHGGEPKKITDVANIPGIDRWYFYY